MTISTSKTVIRRLSMSVPLFLLLAGCGPSQDEMMAKDRLEQARVVYQQAKANPNVTGNAQVPLMEAEKDLRAAETTTDYKEMENLAYLAQKKSETALALADANAADRELGQLQKESNEAILSKKEREMTAKGRELERVKTEAERSKSESERSRTEAERSKSEAERSKSEAEQSKSEAERMKTEAERMKAEAEKAKLDADKARAENEQLMRELSELKGKQTERGIVLTIGDVLFETGKANLSTQANVSIAKLAQFLLNHPTRNLSIEGHTDSVGSDKYNDALSERRAEGVKKALLERGVGAERIVTKGLGKRYPVASNATAQGRQLNRRVEVVILNEGLK
jgi:outer membrane protein OmpA-like peptidoglycan-associated protein